MTAKAKETFPMFGEIVVRKKLASPRVISEALTLQRLESEECHRTPRLGELLIMRNILDEKTVRDILDEQKLGKEKRKILKIKTKRCGDVAIVTLEGRLDQYKGESLKRAIDALMDQGIAKFAINSEKLVYMNIHGISSIIALVDEARIRGGDVKFFNPVYVGFIFERLGLDKFIQIFDTEDEAVAELSKPVDDFLSRGAMAEYLSDSAKRQFHLSYCKHVRKIPLKSQVYYQSRKDAVSSGKKPCHLCKP